MARWAFTQWELRERARAKFSRPDRMFFDREGLEMASHEELSKGVHTWAFPEGARVADLTVGIGGDLIGLSLNHVAIGFETDPERAEIAQYNLEVYDKDADIRVQDCLDAPWDFEYAFADPARRSGGKRTLDPSQFAPRLDQLVPRMQELRFGRIKLSPMLADEFLDTLGPNRVFVSHHGECKEVLIHVGREVPSDNGLHGCWSYAAGSGDLLPGEVPATEILDEPLEYVFEADPAVIRSHGLGNYGMPGLGESNGYLTSGERQTGWRKEYRVLWHGPFHDKDVRLALSERDVRADVVKTRGVDIDVGLLRRQFGTGPRKPAVLLVYPTKRSIMAVIAEPPAN